MTSFYLRKELVSKFSHIQRSWGSGPQHMTSGGRSPVHNEGLAGEVDLGVPADRNPVEPFSRRKESVHSEVRGPACRGAELGAERAAFPPIVWGPRNSSCRPWIDYFCNSAGAVIGKPSLAFLAHRLLEGALCFRDVATDRRRHPETRPQGQLPRLCPVRGAARPRGPGVA